MKRTALLAALLLLPACGGDDGAREEYVEQAQAICAAADEQRRALPQPSGAADFAPFVESVADLLRGAATDLRALEEPEDDRAELEQRILDPLDAVVAEAAAYAEEVAAAGDDQAALITLLGQRPGTGDVDLEFAAEYGLTSCVDAVSV